MTSRDDATFPLEKLAYSVPEVARALGISRSQVYIEIAAGRLTSLHAGKRHLIRREAAVKWLDNLKP